MNRNYQIGNLAIHVAHSPRQLGELAGAKAATILRSVLAERDKARVAFAAAPSQDATLAALANEDGLDWSRVEAFQLDDYVGLDPRADGTFSRYLEEHLFGLVHPGATHIMDLSDRADDAARCYGGLVTRSPLDLVLLGIGENGHLAFNDPPDADRHDPEAVRVVSLDERSRVQQVNDGCFAVLDEVPTRAVTLTLPTLLDANSIVCSVPGVRKRSAVTAALTAPVGSERPASFLREHPCAFLYLDADSDPEARA